MTDAQRLQQGWSQSCSLTGRAKDVAIDISWEHFYLWDLEWCTQTAAGLMGKVLPSTASHLGNSVKKGRRPVKDKEEVKWAVVHYRKKKYEKIKYIYKYIFFRSVSILLIRKTVRWSWNERKNTPDKSSSPYSPIKATREIPAHTAGFIFTA